ncbi:MAG: outer membrane beta-barrel protein [Steroidobacteraceae bacterium]
MKIVNAMVGSLLLAAVPLAAQAEDMSYSYIDLGYAETDVDGGPTGDGFGVRGSVGFAENFFVFADYLSQDFGFVDVDVYSVGLGAHLGIAENVDLVGRVGYLEADASASGLSGNVDGYLVAAGLRTRLADSFELEGNVIYRDLGSGADDTAIAIGGRYFFTDGVAVGAEYEHGDDGSTIFAGVRFSF